MSKKIHGEKYPGMDEREYIITLSNCPLCKGEWTYYEGLLGYESYKCKDCNFDFASIKLSAQDTALSGSEVRR